MTGPVGLDWERTGRDWVAPSRTMPGHVWVLVAPAPDTSTPGWNKLSRDPYTVNLVNTATDESTEVGQAPTRMHAAHQAARVDWILGQEITVERIETTTRRHRFPVAEFAKLVDRPLPEVIALTMNGDLVPLVQAELDDGYEHPEIFQETMSRTDTVAWLSDPKDS